MKKNLFVALCLSLGIAFSGCGAQEKAPTNATELLEKYQANANSNMKAKIDMNMAMRLELAGASMEMPYSISMDLSILDKNVHGNMDLKISLFGEEMNENMEMYVETQEDKATSYTIFEGQCRKNETSIPDYTNLDTKLIADGVFEKGEFEYDKEKEEYKISIPYKELMNSESSMEAVQSYFDMIEAMDFDIDKVMEEMGNKKISYCFDKEYHLLSYEMETCHLEMDMEESGVSMTVKMDIDMKGTFSDHGKVTEEDVKIPEDVKASAKEGEADVSTLFD